jgi:fructoselysine-6-P-deglycase FrlB-like protein
MTTSQPALSRVTQTQVEVESQPAIWARVIAEASATTALLPAPGVPVLFLGCGTSYYVGETYARRRSSMGLGRTRAAIASEVPWVDPEETLVVLSRSGTTTDLVRAVERIRGHARVVGIIGEAGTPVADVCDQVILLDYADEQSIVQTRFATASIVLLRASLGEDLGSLPEAGRQALAWPLQEKAPRHVVFLGSGWTIGLAHEAALKCREAAGAWTEAYPIMEYQHGPIAAAGPGSLVWSLTAVPDFVRDSIEATGARLLAPTLDPVAQLAAVHRLALQLAEAAGRDPDHPLFLSRSVQLD